MCRKSLSVPAFWQTLAPENPQHFDSQNRGNCLNRKTPYNLRRHIDIRLFQTGNTIWQSELHTGF